MTNVLLPKRGTNSGRIETEDIAEKLGHFGGYDGVDHSLLRWIVIKDPVNTFRGVPEGDVRTGGRVRMNLAFPERPIPFRKFPERPDTLGNFLNVFS